MIREWNGKGGGSEGGRKGREEGKGEGRSIVPANKNLQLHPESCYACVSVNCLQL